MSYYVILPSFRFLVLSGVWLQQGAVCHAASTCGGEQTAHHVDGERVPTEHVVHGERVGRVQGGTQAVTTKIQCVG